MPMGPEERLYVAASAAFLEDTILPARRPGHQQPDYWTLPITLTTIVDVPSSPNWQDLIVVQPAPNYEAVINKYVATTVPYPAPGANASNFAFRFLDDKGLEPHIEKNYDQNVHQDILYPLVQRATYINLTDITISKLQVRNTTGNTIRTVAALLGWQYYDPDSSGEKSETIVDA